MVKTTTTMTMLSFDICACWNEVKKILNRHKFSQPATSNASSRDQSQNRQILHITGYASKFGSSFQGSESQSTRATTSRLGHHVLRVLWHRKITHLMLWYLDGGSLHDQCTRHRRSKRTANKQALVEIPGLWKIRRHQLRFGQLPTLVVSLGCLCGMPHCERALAVCIIQVLPVRVGGGADGEHEEVLVAVGATFHQLCYP